VISRRIISANKCYKLVQRGNTWIAAAVKITAALNKSGVKEDGTADKPSTSKCSIVVQKAALPQESDNIEQSVDMMFAH
jgi:hypothetical protein